MKRFCTFLLVPTVLAGLACSNGLTDSAGELTALTVPELMLSNALSSPAGGAVSDAAGAGTVAYVSLPPGTLPQMVSVRIRNASTGLITPAIPVVDGGFDPVPVAGGVGDALELMFTEATGSVSVAHAIIPPRRLPSVVRVSPPRGRTAVALNVRPLVIFSEPIDSRTLAAGVRLHAPTGTQVEVSVSLHPDQPWIAELVLANALEPGATYELQITTEVRDLGGDALAEPITATFTTASAASPGTIAFWSTRSGAAAIHVANADGSNVRRLVEGILPAWSPDGRKIAFFRQQSSSDGPAGIYVMNSDGSDTRYLGPGNGSLWTDLSWTPDDRILFATLEGIVAMNSDGSGRTQVLSRSWLCTPPSVCSQSDGLYHPTSSPDGRSIAFLARTGADRGVGIVNADGSAPRLIPELYNLQERFDERNGVHTRPAWSADGSRIAVITGNDWLLSTYPYVIYRYDIASAELQVVHRAPGFGFGGAPNYPGWSPDGRHIVFDAASRHGPWNGDGDPRRSRRIFTVSVETGEVRRLIPDATGTVVTPYSDWGAVWAPAPRNP